MKHKYLAVLMGIMITASSVNVYAAEAASETNQEEASEETSEDKEESSKDKEDTLQDHKEASQDEQQQKIFGEVTSVGEKDITIAVGTRKDMSEDRSPGEPGGSEGDSAERDEEAGTEKKRGKSQRRSAA